MNPFREWSSQQAGGRRRRLRFFFGTKKVLRLVGGGATQAIGGFKDLCGEWDCRLILKLPHLRQKMFSGSNIVLQSCEENQGASNHVIQWQCLARTTIIITGM